MDIALQADVAKPPDEVFAYLRDLDRWPEWRSALRAAVPETEGQDARHAEGARWRLQLHAMGHHITMRVELSRVDPPSTIEVVTVEGPMGGRSLFRVEPLQDGSRVHLEATVSLSGPLQLLEGVLGPQIRDAWQHDLAALAARLGQQ